MKEIFINTHTSHCDFERKQMEESDYDHISYFSTYCEKNPNYFLFCLFNEFILIKYHKCHSEFSASKIDLHKEFIRLTLVKYKKMESFDIEKSINLELLLKDKEYMEYDTRFCAKHINCIYHDNAKKYFAVTTTTPKSSNTIFNKEEFEKNYIEARKNISEKEIPFLLNEIDSLYETIIEFNKLYNRI